MGGSSRSLQIDPNIMKFLIDAIAESRKQKSLTSQGASKFDLLSSLHGNPFGQGQRLPQGQQLSQATDESINPPGTNETRQFTQEQKAQLAGFLPDLIKGKQTQDAAIAKEDRGVGREIAKEGRARAIAKEKEEEARGFGVHKDQVAHDRKIEFEKVKASLRGAGIEITTNPDGTMTFKQGGKGGTNLQKSTLGAIDKDIIAGQKMIGQLNEAESLFKPEFLTRGGQAKSFGQEQINKLGFDNNTDFLQAKSKWKTQSKQAFLAYRKWVTGVAGGEKEMAEIATAFPDPDNNSPAQYSANLDQTRKWGRVLDKWLRETKANGLSLSETREIVEEGDGGSDIQSEIDNLDAQIKALEGGQ